MKRILTFALAIAPLALSGCRYHADQENPRNIIVATGRAAIEPRSGSTTNGYVTFQQRLDGTVTVQASLADTTEGLHGLHVHEIGDCSDPEAKSAGGHFNPGNHPHGPFGEDSHAGDLGNVVVSKEHQGASTQVTRALTVLEGPSSVVGKAVVVHATVDDLITQPTGNSGGRIGCGVVTLVAKSNRQ